MATLLVGAAVNIGVGLAINTLFPPDDIQQEGPRLTELGFTSAAYGRFVNITFGTDRLDGNIIETTDPPIEEVINKESQTVGKGGGQEVETTTYTYFFTGRISFGIEGGQDLIRLWGDGKIIYDASGTSQLVKEGVTLIFYGGGPDQIQDPEEVSRRGTDIPAYGHLTSVKIFRMPLADFGNRIPNFTAEIAYASEATTPFITMTEPTGFNPPGALSGADVSYMAFDPTRNALIGLKAEGNGMWAAGGSSLDFQRYFADGVNSGFVEPGYSPSGHLYRGNGFANATLLHKDEIDTGETVGTFGNTGITTSDTASNYGNSGFFVPLLVTVPGVGQKDMIVHFNTNVGGSNGTITDGTLLEGATNPIVKVLGTGDGFPNESWKVTGIPDHDRNRMFVFCVNTASNTYELHKIEGNLTFGTGGVLFDSFDISLVRSFSRGSVSNDFDGTGNPQGWAVNRVSGDIMLCNGTTIVLYNPDTDTILAKLQNGNLRGRNNYYSGSIFAFGRGGESNGVFNVVDTRDLSIIRTIDAGTIGWPSTGGEEVFHDESLVWDDRVQALFLSRVDLNSDAPTDARILKLFVNRVNGLGVGLDFVVNALSTSYQRQTMAGLEDSDTNVTTLAGDSVLGYTINRASTMKAALEPLRARYQFDAIQSDWIMKFPKRGQTSILTIPEEEVGLLKRGRDQTDEPAIREIRQDDLSLPMSLAVRYRNKNTDYQVDIERDKRHLFPNPTMRSKSELTLDIPIVDLPTNMKQTAQRQLLTIWNERVSYKTVIPWTYLKLDPTDVFNLGVFGETAQIRMTENDLGAGWAIDMTGVVQDTKSFSSTLAGGVASGHINQNVPSSLPTRAIFLDAPLLNLADLTFNSISRAYVAMAGFESSWPGGSTLRSLDGLTYTPTALSKLEAAIARVKTAPTTWNRGDNRFQPASEGGTMDITPVRRGDVWASAADEVAVLNGANYLAVVTSAGVEVIGFRDVVDNDDGTFTLSHLIRGRLGTEHVSETGPAVGDQIVLLADSTGVQEEGPIQRQDFAIADLNQAWMFKAVTIGTLLEDAPEFTFTYTGADVRPYSVAHPVIVGSGGGGADVSWERRTRGPKAGEWLDGTGDVPLNEAIERYKVTLNTPGAGDFISKTVDDVKTVNFTKAEVDLSGAGSVFGPETNWLTPDGSFPAGEDPETGGGLWVVHTGGFSEISSVASQGNITAPPSGNTGGTNFMVLRLSNSATVTNAVRQDVLLTDLGLSLNDVAKMSFFLSCWVAQDRVDGGVRVRLQLLNGAKDQVLVEANQGEFDTGAPYGDWTRIGSTPTQDFNSRPLKFTGVTGGVHLRVICYLFKRGTLFSTDRSAYDELLLEVTQLPSDLTAKVVQISETGVESIESIASVQ